MHFVVLNKPSRYPGLNTKCHRR